MRRLPLIFSTRSYEYLTKEIEHTGGFEHGKLPAELFPDGELHQQILSHVVERDVIIVGGTISDSDTLEIFDLACALVKYGANQLTIVIPYFGYSTMERATKPGDVVKAKTRALLFSSIPRASHGNRIYLLDLHSEGIPYYFEGEVTTRHIYAKQLVAKAARKIAGQRKFVLASTDAGRAKWVESLAKDLGVMPAFAYKARIDGSTVESRGVSGPVDGKLVIIYDDMIRSGGSLIKAAEAYKAAGAAEIAAIATHGLFPDNGLERLQQSGLFTRIITTNSHPNAVRLAGDFLSVISVAELLANNL